jgi:ferredoxin-NADP reductase
VTAIRQETATVRSFTFNMPAWQPHLAGQHYDIRLTAPDGYQAQRSYSVASEPMRSGEIDLTVERIEGGEVSSYLHDIVTVGDRLEIRGPIGGYFVWEAAMGGPLLLIAGGSGVVPLMSMLRHRAGAAMKTPTALLFSSRRRDDVIYFDELESLRATDPTLHVFHTLTRDQPPGWAGYGRRIDQSMLTDVLAVTGGQPRVFICGPTLLVEAAAEALVALAVDPSRIRTERFGPAAA